MSCTVDLNFKRFEELLSNTGIPHCMYPVMFSSRQELLNSLSYIFLILCILVLRWIRTGTEENTLVSEQVFLALKITWGQSQDELVLF